MESICSKDSVIQQYCSPDSAIMRIANAIMTTVGQWFTPSPPPPPPNPLLSLGMCGTISIVAALIILALLMYISKLRSGLSDNGERDAPLHPADTKDASTNEDGLIGQLQNAADQLSEVKNYSGDLTQKAVKLIESKMSQLEEDTNATQSQIKKLQNLKDKNLAKSRELQNALENLDKELEKSDQEIGFQDDFKAKDELNEIANKADGYRPQVNNFKNKIQSNRMSPDDQQRCKQLISEVEKFCRDKMGRLRQIESQLDDSKSKQAKQRVGQAIKTLRDILEQVQDWTSGAGDADGSNLSDESKSRMKDIESKADSIKANTEQWKQLYLDSQKHCQDKHMSKELAKKKCGKRRLPSPEPFNPEKEKYPDIEIPEAPRREKVEDERGSKKRSKSKDKTKKDSAGTEHETTDDEKKPSGRSGAKSSGKSLADSDAKAEALTGKASRGTRREVIKEETEDEMSSYSDLETETNSKGSASRKGTAIFGSKKASAATGSQKESRSVVDSTGFRNSRAVTGATNASASRKTTGATESIRPKRESGAAVEDPESEVSSRSGSRQLSVISETRDGSRRPTGATNVNGTQRSSAARNASSGKASGATGTQRPSEMTGTQQGSGATGSQRPSAATDTQRPSGATGIQRESGATGTQKPSVVTEKTGSRERSDGKESKPTVSERPTDYFPDGETIDETYDDVGPSASGSKKGNEINRTSSSGSLKNPSDAKRSSGTNPKHSKIITRTSSDSLKDASEAKMSSGENTKQATTVTMSNRASTEAPRKATSPMDEVKEASNNSDYEYEYDYESGN